MPYGRFTSLPLQRLRCKEGKGDHEVVDEVFTPPGQSSHFRPNSPLTFEQLGL
jgi:hypothetical protein